MLVTVDEAGRATRVAGDPGHPITAGFLCGKVSNYSSSRRASVELGVVMRYLALESVVCQASRLRRGASL